MPRAYYWGVVNQRTEGDMDRIKVRCLECGKRFTTRSMLPECPKCGGGDIELADPMDAVLTRREG